MEKFSRKSNENLVSRKNRELCSGEKESLIFNEILENEKRFLELISEKGRMAVYSEDRLKALEKDSIFEYDLSVIIIIDANLDTGAIKKRISCDLTRVNYEVIIFNQYQDEYLSLDQIMQWALIKSKGKNVIFCCNHHFSNFNLLNEKLDKECSFCSVGKTELERVIFPSADVFGIRKKDILSIGSLDMIFLSAKYQLTDFCVRLIKNGFQAKQISIDDTNECKYFNISKNEADIDEELFILKNQMFLPSENLIANELVDAFSVKTGNILIIANTIPQIVEKIFSTKTKIHSIVKEFFSSECVKNIFCAKVVNGEFKDIYDINEKFDSIIYCDSINNQLEFLSCVDKITDMLNIDGKFLFFDENVVGVHRLNYVLTTHGYKQENSNYSLTDIKKTFNNSSLVLDNKLLTVDLEKESKFNELISSLQNAYPNDSQKILGSLRNRASLYCVTKIQGGN